MTMNIIKIITSTKARERSSQVNAKEKKGKSSQESNNMSRETTSLLTYHKMSSPPTTNYLDLDDSRSLRVYHLSLHVVA